MKHKKSISLIVSVLLSFAMHMFFLLKKINTDKQEDLKQEQSLNNSGKGEEDGKQKIWFRKSEIPCNSYDGIGVQYSQISGVISHVAAGGPADRAGIKVGDEFITPVWYMDFKFNQKVEIIVKRDNVNLKFNVLIDRICKDEDN